MSMTMSNRHLQALGITAWTRRSLPDTAPAPEKISPAADPPGFIRLNSPQAAVGAIILEWTRGEMSLSSDDPGGNLLASILGAIGTHCDSFQILQLDRKSGLGDLSLLPLAGSFVLCFVENWQVEPGLRQDRQWLSLPSLQQMLSERQFKRQAWQQLKPWASKLVHRQDGSD